MSKFEESDKEKIARLEAINSNIIDNLKGWEKFTPDQTKFKIEIIVRLLENNSERT